MRYQPGRPAPRSVTRCHSIEDLRMLARRRLPRSIFDFIDGGAQDEVTLRDNAQAFQRLRFAPHVLRDVSAADGQSPVCGAPAGLPAVVGPTGGAAFGWRDADIHLAQAAAKANLPFTLSSSGTASIEHVARASSGRLWFQAYVLKNREFFWKLVARAEAANYEALVITVDLPVGGKRERDFHNRFSVPFRPSAGNLLDFACHPGWTLDLLRRGIPVFENLRGIELEAMSATTIASSVGRSYDPSFDWRRLEEVRARWPRKLFVKGVNRGEDASRLAAMGCDAVVVSNHGGRQLDGAIATLDALPEVLQGAGSRLPVMLDGGVRRGGDIAKALALGAHAVLLGRATLFGVAAGGRAGADKALDILRDEFVRTLQLCGLSRPGELSRDILRTHGIFKETDR